jgi:hypothetical protein
MGMPSRAVKNLMGHARPRGDASTWPLDDEMIGQFQDALKIRKKVTNAAQLYHLLLFVATISAAVFILVTIFTFLIPGRGRHSPPLAILPASFFTIAFSVLYFFVERATRRSHRWAPLTMFIVFTASLVVQICTVGFSIMLQSSARPGTVVGMTVSFLILVLFSGGFALVSWGAFAAIPKYLQKPAWCQELIVKAGL